MKSSVQSLALLLSLGALSGCAGARSSLSLPASHYPVSLSDGMLGPNRELLAAGEMETVSHFHETRTAWSTFYALVPFTPRLDLSESINAQIAAAHGDAIVRLRTSSRPCALDYFFGLTLLPIWPGCASIEIDGDIVRYRATARTATPR